MRYGLFILCLAGLCWQYRSPCRAQDPRAQANRKQPLSPLIRLQGDWRTEVIGMGRTHEEAREDAIKQAAEALALYLRQQTPSLFDGDTKDPATLQRLKNYVMHDLSVGNGKAEKDQEVVQGVEPFKTWSLPLQRDPDWSHIIRTEQIEMRQGRALDRQMLSIKVLGGLILLFFTGIGYVRLDQWTHKRYTPWLRVGTAAAVTALGSLAWLWAQGRSHF